MRTLLTAGMLFTPLDAVTKAAVLVEDGRIISCGPRGSIELPPDTRQLDFPDAILAPGFIDIHIHGAAGHDSMQIGTEGARKMGNFLARHGVTAYLPTTVTTSESDTLQALQWLADAVDLPPTGNIDKPCARPLGIHLEGPFISHARCGVHPAAYIQLPDIAALERYRNASRDRISVITVAPEVPGALELIRSAVAQGIRVSVGHTNATLEETKAAVDAGACNATHTFNAMRRFEHRDPGVIGAVLTDDRIYADLIADGLHVMPPVVEMFLRCKGKERAILISDATSATGMPPGRYHLGAFEVEVDGLRCDSHGKLAGSVLTLDVALQNVMQFAGWSLQDSVRLITLNPAALLGIEKKKGQLIPGADADIVVLSPNGEVLSTFIGGQGI